MGANWSMRSPGCAEFGFAAFHEFLSLKEKLIDTEDSSSRFTLSRVVFFFLRNLRGGKTNRADRFRAVYRRPADQNILEIVVHLEPTRICISIYFFLLFFRSVVSFRCCCCCCPVGATPGLT